LRIVRARQISQLFFVLLFLWFCLVTTAGEAWWHLRGWPVNLFLQLDPLVALGTVVATRVLYAGLLWALLTVVLTILLGRFFCGWVCPFGTLQHFVGFLGGRGKTAAQKAARNRHHRGQMIKYVLLVFLVGVAAGDLIAHPPGFASERQSFWGPLIGLCLPGGLWFGLRKTFQKEPWLQWVVWTAFFVGTWLVLGGLFSAHDLMGGSLQTGLLDPIPLLSRSVNLVVLPLLDGASHQISVSQRFTLGGSLIGMILLAVVLIGIRMPRFYCRFVCPLGALFAVLGRFALWRVGRREQECKTCKTCEIHCEGACEPSQMIRVRECILCMNCLDSCPQGNMGFRTVPSASGEIDATGVARRGFVLSLFSGLAMVPLVRLGGAVGANWSSRVIRPPGALVEEDFLARCIKCGQCMRICPTNIIHPAGLEGGLEGLWSPTLNFRIGTSGCQYNCTVCGHVCPTAAIRAITLDEKQGKNAFALAGPIRLGTAFLDQGRCLPWSMDKPCIVCQENCPVSPKAIFTRDTFLAVREGPFSVKRVTGRTVELEGKMLKPGAVATGDYYFHARNGGGAGRVKITENGENHVVLATPFPDGEGPAPGSAVDVEILLRRPFVSPEKCIGCGICEHECPVSGKRAIRVTAENESRSTEHALVAGGRVG
jgi:polyferredoxin/Pyruvate/2-oxoacid:ferredoxin oxidoreductase delta subunit